MAPHVEVGIGLAQNVPEEEVERTPERCHAPGPFEQVRRHVLEEGAADALGSREDRMRPIPPGADTPDMQRQVAGAPPQLGEPGFDVEVEKPVSPQVRRKVQRQGVIPRGAQGFQAAPPIEIGPTPGQPRRKKQNRAAGRAVRRQPGRGERVSRSLPVEGDLLARLQRIRGSGNDDPGKPRRQGEKQTDGCAFFCGRRTDGWGHAGLSSCGDWRRDDGPRYTPVTKKPPAPEGTGG